MFLWPHCSASFCRSLCCRQSSAQEGALDKSQPKGITVEEIIKRFAAKEKLFKEARDQYTYRQDVKVMTLDGDTPDGTYQYVFDVTFDDKGRKFKNVVFAPQTTLQRIMMTEEDLTTSRTASRSC